MAKEKYYSLGRILKHKALYNVIFGQRSNGKTFSVIDLMLKHFVKTGEPSAYIRRLDSEIMPAEIFRLLTPHRDNIIKYTKGKYNTHLYKSRVFYLAYVDEGGNVVEMSEPFLFCFALSRSSKSKGADRGHMAYTLFDEFLTRSFYLQDEFVLYCEVLATLIRDRDGTINFLVGNTVNRYCPYFSEMGLTHVDEQKQGTIDLYTYGDSGLTVAVEYCPENEVTKKVSKYFSFDNPHLQMIHSGVWEFANYPHAPEKIPPSAIINRSFVEFDSHLLCINIVHTDDVYLYVTPHTRDVDDKHILFTDTPAPTPYHILDIQKSNLKICAVIWGLILARRVYYTDNTTGEIFNNWIKSNLNRRIYK
jgi:hypothetical protein